MILLQSTLQRHCKMIGIGIVLEVMQVYVYKLWFRLVQFQYENNCWWSKSTGAPNCCHLPINSSCFSPLPQKPLNWLAANNNQQGRGGYWSRLPPMSQAGRVTAYVVLLQTMCLETVIQYWLCKRNSVTKAQGTDTNPNTHLHAKWAILGHCHP